MMTLGLVILNGFLAVNMCLGAGLIGVTRYYSENKGRMMSV